jgi:quercetin dioxygenase-like cupin family protein
MFISHVHASLVLAVLAPACIHAQSAEAKPEWELLMQKPLPDDVLPNIHVVRLAPRNIPRPSSGGHTHAGPVVGYIVQGEIEIQIEPTSPETYKPGDVFYEAPRQLHRFTRNLSTTEPGNVLAFMAGYGDGPAPSVKVKFHDDLSTTIDQDLRLLRLSLPPGAGAVAPVNANRDVVTVLEGRIEITGVGTETKTFGPSDFFAKPSNQAGIGLRNASATEAAKVLLFQVAAKGTPKPAP